MPVKIFDIKGRKPIITPRLLPMGYAQTAENVKLGSGAMECLRALGSSVDTPSATPKTIYKFGSTYGGNGWFTWPARRWVEKAAISGTELILVSDGSTYPKIVTSTGTERRLGVVKPTTALTINIGGVASAGGGVVTASYVYTLVTAQGEESDIYTATAAVDITDGQWVYLTGWCVHNGNKAAWLTSTGNDIAYIRVYRLESDAAGNAEYQRVGMRPTAGGTAVFSIPITDIVSDADTWFDINAGQTWLSDDPGEVIMTEGWDPAPTAMKGACMFSNGMYAGFIDNLIYLSVPGYYYAFPASGTMDYTMELPFDVVAMAAFNETLVVGTKGFPEVISGSDPAYMTRTPLPYQQPCLSAQGMISIPGGVVYVCPDGLFLIHSGGGEIITRGVITRDDWQDLDLDSAILAYYDQKIFIFFEGDDAGLIYDPALDYLVDFDLPANVAAVFVDPEADILYVATSAGIYAWEGSTSGYLTADWKSGIMETPPVNFSACRVEGVFPTGHSTTLYYYVDGTLKHTQTVTSDAPFRLPSGFRGRDHELRVVFSASTINAIYLGFSMGELANV